MFFSDFRAVGNGLKQDSVLKSKSHESTASLFMQIHTYIKGVKMLKYINNNK